jgi:hypothetical protein
MAFYECDKCHAKLDYKFERKGCPYHNHPILTKFSMQDEVVRDFTQTENGFVFEFDTFTFSIQGKSAEGKSVEL